jgi:sphingomyelin phosphodiesterase
MKLEGPIIAQILRTMTIPSTTSKLFCNTFFGLCDLPDVTNTTLSFPSPKPSAGRPAVSGQTPIQIVQYSDIHVDQLYLPGASSNCTKPICCRNYGGNTAPGSNQFPAGPNGNHKCDVPVSLEESMYSAINEIAPNATFSLFTGDVVDHAVWNTTEAQNALDITDAYTRMTKLGLIYGTIGNHEQSPVNEFQPNALGTNAKWLYSLIGSLWSKWLDASAISDEQDIGAYSTLVPNTNLRIISLNTNLYYRSNFWLYEKNIEEDPNGQFSWLINELQGAENAKQRVYIIGHMPMGLPDAFRDGSNLFDQIVNRYSATIAALFFGRLFAILMDGKC